MSHMSAPRDVQGPWGRWLAAALLALAATWLLMATFPPALLLTGAVALAAAYRERGTTAARWLTLLGALWLVLGFAFLAGMATHLEGGNSGLHRQPAP
jgi:4-hydroxybenzoate polyprenyltransferase